MMIWLRMSQTVASALIRPATITGLLAIGCASSQPIPTQQLADVESANRAATELGAQNNPQAQLYLKLANEQLQAAKGALKDDQNARADWLLRRAKADAELAVALSHDSNAKLSAQKAAEASNAAQSTHVTEGQTP